MSKKEEPYHHGDLRSALLAAAAEMIAEEGVANVTMRGLGRRVGVSRTAPYRHFADKAALLAAVAEDGFKRLAARLQEAKMENAEDRLQGFQSMWVAYVEFAVENPTHYRLMFGQEAFKWRDYPDQAVTARATFEEVVTMVRLCQQDNRLKSGDPHKLAHAAWSLAHGLSSLLIDERIRDPGDIRELAQFTIHTLLDGIGQ